MEDNNNTIAEENEYAEVFKFNFINIPWDDRSKFSKIGIVSLLIVICVAITACVLNNFILHYKSYNYNKIAEPIFEIKCHLVKIEGHPFVAKINLIKTQELLCLGAVISRSSVIANGVCVKSGPIRLGLGSPLNQFCKKWFVVDIINPIRHAGAISNSLVLLTTAEEMTSCSSIIEVGAKIDFNSNAYVLGRPLLPDRGSRVLSRQPATLLTPEETLNITLLSLKNMQKSSLICVKNLSICPVRAGDLLIQNDKLHGLASTSVHRTEQSKVACFADLMKVRQELMDFVSSQNMNN